MEQIDKFCNDPDNQTILGFILVGTWVVAFIVFIISGIRERLRNK